MKSLYRILTQENQRSKKYFQNYIFYAREIKKIIRDFFADARVLIFGSVVRGDYSPDSDIDILVISSGVPQDLFEQAKVKVKIKERFPDALFEIHLVTPEAYENWYKRFIKKDYIEV